MRYFCDAVKYERSVLTLGLYIFGGCLRGWNEYLGYMEVNNKIHDVALTKCSSGHFVCSFIKENFTRIELYLMLIEYFINNEINANLSLLIYL